MPLYEYECGACHHRFEVIQKFSDLPLTECPKCQGTLRKLQSAPAFQLKGTGWYVTDYPKSGQGPAPEKDSGGSGDSSSSSSDKDAAKGDKGEKAEKSGTTEKKTGRTEKTDTSAPAKDSSSPSSTTGSKAAKSET